MIDKRALAAATAIVVAGAAPCAAYYEGVGLTTYQDTVGIPTECIGETGPHVKMGQSFTLTECLARFDKRLAIEWNNVAPCIRHDLEVYQASAILSWEYNVGAHAACGSTLIRLLNANAPAPQWCEQFLRWDKAHIAGVTVTLPGLTKRRYSEREMCLGRVHSFPAPRVYP